MRDLPLVDAPNAKGKKFKEFFHLVEGVSPEDCDRIRTAMNTDPPSLNQLPDSVRPRDALGDSCILQLALSPDESGTYNPDSRRVLAAGEHLQNETNEDKTRLLEKVLKLPGMKVDLLLHDDACHFEKYVKRNNLEAFSDVKHYVVDAFHAPNHKCSKRYWTGAVKKRCAEVRTNLPEVFNAWIRTLNFFFNGLRPHSHKFWVAEACKFYNDNLQDVPLNIGRRKNVVARKNRA